MKKPGIDIHLGGEITDYPVTRANSAIALVRILRTGVFCNYICDAAFAGSGVSYG